MRDCTVADHLVLGLAPPCGLLPPEADGRGSRVHNLKPAQKHDRRHGQRRGAVVDILHRAAAVSGN